MSLSKWHHWPRYVSRKVKYTTKRLSNIWQRFHVYLGIVKMWKKLKLHDGFLSYLQNSWTNLANQTALFCHALVCPQKPIVIMLERLFVVCFSITKEHTVLSKDVFKTCMFKNIFSSQCMYLRVTLISKMISDFL